MPREFDEKAIHQATKIDPKYITFDSSVKGLEFLTPDYGGNYKINRPGYKIQCNSIIRQKDSKKTNTEQSDTKSSKNRRRSKKN